MIYVVVVKVLSVVYDRCDGCKSADDSRRQMQ